MNDLEKYVISHSTPRKEALEWIVRQTHLRTKFPHMLAGFEAGKLLETFSMMLRPRRILELGTFTGYSSVCLAAGLPEEGRLDAVEINDELEDVIREGYRMAGIEGKVRLLFGDCKTVIPSLEEVYDLVYIDANKREYPEYLSLIMGDSPVGGAPKVRSGSWIIADNVLWDGKILGDSPKGDPQSRGIASFNDLVAADPRLENFILPLRDGLNTARVL
ncbi:MAG: O-methyltransferase [Bacteroidales bacterium]|nr:O-methyltransferase [Bacteroidales bacterium]